MTNASPTESLESSEFANMPIITEDVLRGALVCEKEVQFAVEYLQENNESLQLIIELMQAVQFCQNELKFSKNGTCDLSHDKINSLAAKIRNNHTLMNQITNIMIHCSNIPLEVLQFTELLIQENKLPKNDIYLKNPQESNPSPLQSRYNLKGGFMSDEAYMKYVQIPAFEFFVFLASPMIGIYAAINEVSRDPSIKNIAWLATSPIWGPMAVTYQIIKFNEKQRELEERRRNND